MGINKQTLALLLHENAFRPIEGRFLAIGKQTVNVEPDIMFEMLSKYGISTDFLKQKIDSGDLDKTTRRGGMNVYDHDLLSAICGATYNCLDVSDYERADIIQDMTAPIPEHLASQFDFIFDGSCMDNLFDPVCFIRNIARMLKPGGRVIHVECASAVAGAYLMYSPEWFFSYYSINEFKDCKVYATIGRKSRKNNRCLFDAGLYSWKPYFTRDPNYDDIEGAKTIDGLMHAMVIAEKAHDSTYDRTPMQSQYLGPNDPDWREKYHEYCNTGRPLLTAGPKRPGTLLPLNSDHYEYLGDEF